MTYDASRTEIKLGHTAAGLYYMQLYHRRRNRMGVGAGDNSPSTSDWGHGPHTFDQKDTPVDISVLHDIAPNHFI